jgi:hypothetical protein
MTSLVTRSAKRSVMNWLNKCDALVGVEVEVVCVAWIHCECGGAVHRTMETEYFVSRHTKLTRGVSIFRVQAPVITHQWVHDNKSSSTVDDFTACCGCICWYLFDRGGFFLSGGRANALVRLRLYHNRRQPSHPVILLIVIGVYNVKTNENEVWRMTFKIGYSQPQFCLIQVTHFTHPSHRRVSEGVAAMAAGWV